MTPAVGEIGERTELVQTGSHRRGVPRLRRARPIAWILLLIVVAGAAIAGWILFERGRMAADDAAAARAQLGDANQRAAAAEDQLLKVQADRLRPAAPAAATATDLAELASSLRAALDRQAGEVSVDDGAREVIVTLDDPDLFRGDDAELTTRGQRVIDDLSHALVAAGDRPMRVNGAVDDAPLPSDSTFESAWDLSAARAIAVVRRLTDAGLDGRRLSAVALGSGHPVGADRAKNRRVEVVVGDAPAAAAASARGAGERSR